MDRDKVKRLVNITTEDVGSSQRAVLRLPGGRSEEAKVIERFNPLYPTLITITRLEDENHGLGIINKLLHEKSFEKAPSRANAYTHTGMFRKMFLEGNSIRFGMYVNYFRIEEDQAQRYFETLVAAGSVTLG